MRRIAVLFVAVAAATIIGGCGNASVGPTRLVNISLARGCRLALRLPRGVRATVERNTRLLDIAGPGIPRPTRAVCVRGHSAKYMKTITYDPRATNVKKLRDGGFVSVLSIDGGSVGYMVDIQGGTFYIAEDRNNSIAPTLTYLIQHAHGGFGA